MEWIDNYPDSETVTALFNPNDLSLNDVQTDWYSLPLVNVNVGNVQVVIWKSHFPHPTPSKWYLEIEDASKATSTIELFERVDIEESDAIIHYSKHRNQVSFLASCASAAPEENKWTVGVYDIQLRVFRTWHWISSAYPWQHTVTEDGSIMLVASRSVGKETISRGKSIKFQPAIAIHNLRLRESRESTIRTPNGWHLMMVILTPSAEVKGIGYCRRWSWKSFELPMPVYLMQMVALYAREEWVHFIVNSDSKGCKRHQRIRLSRILEKAAV